MFKHTLYLGLLVLILGACSKPADPVYYIEGIILDDIDETPIAGARVTAVRPSSGWFSATITTDTVTTDEFGVFFIKLAHSTDLLGGDYTVNPSQISIEHPDYCPPFGSPHSIDIGSVPTTQMVIRVDPMAFAQVTATNTGAYNGTFDEVEITSLGQVSLELGTVTTGAIHRSCFQLEDTPFIVRYKQEGELIHQEVYTFELTRKDTLNININY